MVFSSRGRDMPAVYFLPNISRMALLTSSASIETSSSILGGAMAGSLS